MIPSEGHTFTQHSSVADSSLGVGEHKDDRSFFKEKTGMQMPPRLLSAIT